MTQWTKEQEAFLSHVASSPKSAVLEALAGTGKTTTIVGAAQLLNGTPALACAFNKKIAVELEKRLPASIDCRTLNGLGHRAWAKHLGKKLTVDADKLYNLCKDLEVEKPWSDVLAITRWARSAGLVPEAQSNPKGLLPDEDFIWEDICELQDVEWTYSKVKSGRELLKASIRQSWRGNIDFDDQLYMPTLWGAPFQKYPTVLIDEAQDISPIQRMMVLKSHSKRVLAVGDRHQAIYGFRGADYTSIDAIAAETDAIAFPMTTTFRCPKAVVRAAQEYVPQYNCPDNMPEGLVRSHDDWSPAELLRSGDTVLCRNNKPLIALAFSLLRQQIPAQVLGGDIGRNLTRLINSLHATSKENLVVLLDRWQAQKIARAEAKGRLSEIDGIRDRAESVYCMIEHTQGETVQDVISTISRIFTDYGSPILLSTIHKAKGMEWDRVFLLDFHLMPSKYARSEEAIQQEHNLAYVSITRSKNELHFITSEMMK